MDTAIVVGAAPLGNEKNYILDYISKNECYKIAADGGIEFFLNNNICPDHFIGDMDSCNYLDRVKETFLDINMDTCSPIKDVTDTEIAIVDAVNKGCHNVMVCGGLGGKRISHSIANIQLISAYKEKGINITMYGEDTLIYALSSGERIDYSADKKGFISVFSLSDISENVSINGFFYNYRGDLSNRNALGVSNEFVGKDAYIYVDKGLLLIVEEVKGV